MGKEASDSRLGQGGSCWFLKGFWAEEVLAADAVLHLEETNSWFDVLSHVSSEIHHVRCLISMGRFFPMNPGLHEILYFSRTAGVIVCRFGCLIDGYQFSPDGYRPIQWKSKFVRLELLITRLTPLEIVVISWKLF